MTSQSWRAVLLRLLAVFILLSFCIPAANEAAPAAANPQPATIITLSIDGEIEPILAEYIVNGIAQANSRHANLVLITMNTPGGLDTSMRAIVQAILRSPVPVVTYVYPTGSRAASAGFFILLSADIAAMSPGTETGAASPIMEIGGQPVNMDATLNRKILNDATAYLRSYTSKRGRNVALAETAVTDAKAFSDKEALDGNLINIVAASPQELLAKLNGRAITRFDGSTTTLNTANYALVPFAMNARERLLSRIVEPDIFFVLLIVAALGLYVEFTHPGVFAPGVIGGIAAVLALYAMQLLPVNITGLLLIFLAIGLFVLEAKFPTHGILGVGGVIAIILGALLLIRSPITRGGVHLGTALGVAIPFALIVIVLMRLVLRSRSYKPSTGKEELVGEVGEVREPVASGAPGMVFIHGELWRAAGRHGAAIPTGARVRVRKVSGLTLEVEPVGETRSLPL